MTRMRRAFDTPTATRYHVRRTRTMHCRVVSGCALVVVACVVVYGTADRAAVAQTVGNAVTAAAALRVRCARGMRYSGQGRPWVGELPRDCSDIGRTVYA